MPEVEVLERVLAVATAATTPVVELRGATALVVAGAGAAAGTLGQG